MPPATSDAFTAERFLPHVGEVFHVVVGGEAQPVPVLLSEVTRLASEGDRRRSRLPFSLVFHSPAGTALEQQIYLMERAGMEPFECFLVPIGADEHGMRFEAIYT